MKRTLTISLIVAIIAILGLTAAFIRHNQHRGIPATLPSSTPVATTSATPSVPTKPLSDPLPNALSRITKKPFGIYITPATSPVQPEKFQGYHTGSDMETTLAEQANPIPVSAACDGKLLMKKYATGYGGVAVESCMLDNQPVTIIYGHLYIDSVKPAVGDTMTAGEQFAILGKAYSQQTDGEREHLHFGIHQGTSVNILGYVQKQSDLSGWLNPADYLQ